MTHQRYNKARDCYEYQCRWQGFARAEDEFRPETDIQADRLIAEYDAAHPRGATRGDRPSDIKSELDSWPISRSGRAIKRPQRLNHVHLIDSSASTDRVADLLFFSQPESCHTFSRDADFAASLDPSSLLFCGCPSTVPAEPRAVEHSRRISGDSSPHFREFRLRLRSVHWHPDVSAAHVALPAEPVGTAFLPANLVLRVKDNTLRRGGLPRATPVTSHQPPSPTRPAVVDTSYGPRPTSAALLWTFRLSLHPRRSRHSPSPTGHVPVPFRSSTLVPTRHLPQECFLNFRPKVALKGQPPVGGRVPARILLDSMFKMRTPLYKIRAAFDVT